MARQRPQRESQSMTDDEVNAYLDARDEWAILTTIGADGYPHSVALGYFRIGDDIYLGMKDRTQKVLNAERNPKASVMVCASKASGEISGVAVQGDASIVRDRAERLELARTSARQRGSTEDDLPSQVSEGGVYLKVSKRATISWNYR